jgi:hypothetical protein
MKMSQKAMFNRPFDLGQTETWNIMFESLGVEKVKQLNLVMTFHGVSNPATW